ncbi:hypothetical protein RchiOBHm_Chr1g0348761 [Rosa chinensis]|uniref:Uncharacterized protein n=1 Tax=Rosa chinensis TaxID=74649 RepID=A0A2P6SFP3_ROSCH|nr:hypothetical protein RchiOBHm_Chr1g0348761 [Rosa chinensis]
MWQYFCIEMSIELVPRFSHQISFHVLRMVTSSFLSSFKYLDNLIVQTKTKKIDHVETSIKECGRDLLLFQFKFGTVVLLVSFPIAEFRPPSCSVTVLGMGRDVSLLLIFFVC